MNAEMLTPAYLSSVAIGCHFLLVAERFADFLVAEHNGQCTLSGTRVLSHSHCRRHGVERQGEGQINAHAFCRL